MIWRDEISPPDQVIHIFGISLPWNLWPFTVLHILIFTSSYSHFIYFFNLVVNMKESGILSFVQGFYHLSLNKVIAIEILTEKLTSLLFTPSSHIYHVVLHPILNKEELKHSSI